MKKLVSICLLICTTAAFSQSIGTLLYTVNKVVAQQGSKARTVTRGSQIYTGDIIVTGKDASTQLKYTNGTLVTIEANSRYQTVDYNLKQDVTLKSNLDIGAIDYKSTGKKKALIKTPIVALAILGTHFQLSVTPDTIYLNIMEGNIRINGVIYGPGNPYSSGTFDKNGKFTPGSIPWSYPASPALNTSQPGTIPASTAGVAIRPSATRPKAALPETSTAATSGLNAVNPSTTAEITELVPSLLINGFDETNPNLTIEITELIPSLVIDTAMNAIIDFILPLSELAQVQLLFPLVIIGI